MTTAIAKSPRIYKDPMAQKLSDKWWELREILTEEQEDRIAFLYVSKCLNLGDKVYKKFYENLSDVSDIVGMAERGENFCPNLLEFWNGVNKIFQNLHTDKDITFLCEKGELTGVIAFLSVFDAPGRICSSGLSRLFSNMHAFK